MRPVKRPPNPNTYPKIQLDTLAHLEADLKGLSYDPGPLVRNGLNIPAPTPVTGLDVVNGLLALALNPSAKKRKQVAAPPTPLAQAKAGLETFVEGVYKKAILPLKEGLGLYCSYCEQVLSEAIAVEHVAPKAPYPLTSLCWENFLLSCRACNSRKSDDPSRSELATWGVPSTATELERYEAIRGHYLWPDEPNPATVNPYTALRTALCYRKGTGWAILDPGLAVDDGLAVVKKGTAMDKTVTANVPFPAGAKVVDVEAQIVSTNVAKAKASASWKLLGLGISSDGNDDNRMWHRTEAWFTARESFRLLRQVEPKDFQGHFQQLCMTARATGFLSTWVRVLQLRGGGALPIPPATTTPPSLLDHFLAAMLTPYPNTDVQYMR